MSKKTKELARRCSFLINDPSILESGNIYIITKKKDLENELEKIFSTVTKTFPHYLQTPVLYLLGELTDNINQHSLYTEGIVFLKYDKETKRIHILISDDGISIPGGFEKNKVSFNNDSEAIEMAMKGKSTKKEEGRGFGLPSSKKLVEKGFRGGFIVASRNGIYRKGNSNLDFPKIKGTIVYAGFEDKGEGLNIYEYLT